ncbi:MAG TPA: universal stress protein [Rhizomicrobium sp.]|jgi:nucleotide-binding universal stress UspA family protein
MSYRKILAPLTGAPRDACVMETAVAAAGPFSGRIEALFVKPNPADAMPAYGEAISGVIAQEMVDAARDAVAKGAEAARTVFDRYATGVEAEFRVVEGAFADAVAQAARLSDLIVFGALKDAGRLGLSDAFETTLLTSGRPVLLRGATPVEEFAKRICVAWDGSSASVHAMLCAMPFFRRAQSVDVLVVQPQAKEECEAVKAYLAVHGVTAAARAIDPGGRGVGEALLEAAKGSGLLVMGGYGHGRIRLFGTPVTKYIVGNAEMPLLLMH